jgi:hypothetical protein
MPWYAPSAYATFVKLPDQLDVIERDNVVYWKTNGKINNDLQCD